MVCVHGGYKTQTVTQISNIVSTYNAGEITLSGMRVYFGSLVIVASREAAKRTRSRNRRGGEIVPRYFIKELSRLTRLSLRVIKKELLELEKFSLLSFSDSQVVFEDTPCEGSFELREELSGNRSPKRPVPLPRTLLRFLAQCSKASIIKTALCYAVRGLTLSRKGEITAAGSAKATWIGDTMNLSERSVRSARAELLKIGFITDDENSTQMKLNRTGVYFSVNLDWIGGKKCAEQAISKEVGQGTTKTHIGERPPVDNSSVPIPNFAPPIAQKCNNFAPPYKYKKTLYRSNNQKTSGSAPKPTGVCTANFGNRRQSDLPPPSIRDVRREDLKSFGRVEVLYRQAVKHGLIEGTEAGAINFISAAVRATNVSGDAPRIFVGIVRKKLWKHITQSDEDRALRALRKYRADDPNRFRVDKTPTPLWPNLMSSTKIQPNFTKHV